MDTAESVPSPNSAPVRPPPTNKQRFTVAQIVDGLQRNRGLICLTARALKCDPSTIRNYARRYPAVQTALDHEREYTTDTAEAALFRAIANGEAWAVRYYLSTQGKSRGYVERTELGGVDGEPIKFIVLEASPGRSPADRASPEQRSD